MPEPKYGLIRALLPLGTLAVGMRKCLATSGRNLNVHFKGHCQMLIQAPASAFNGGISVPSVGTRPQTVLLRLLHPAFDRCH